MVQAVILDFDGVVVESLDVKLQAFLRLAESYGAEVLAAARRRNPFGKGITRSIAIRRFFAEELGRDLAPAEADGLVRRFGDLVEEAVVRAPLVPGVREFIETQARRLVLFVVSSTPEEELARIVAARGLAPFFREVRGFPPAKPENVMALLSRWGIAPSTAVLVGDTAEDQRAAVAAGIRFVGRAIPGRPSPFGPDIATIRDFVGEEPISRIFG